MFKIVWNWIWKKSIAVFRFYEILNLGNFALSEIQILMQIILQIIDEMWLVLF